MTETRDARPITSVETEVNDRVIGVRLQDEKKDRICSCGAAKGSYRHQDGRVTYTCPDCGGVHMPAGQELAKMQYHSRRCE